jgi:putative DNA primase/helicase
LPGTISRKLKSTDEAIRRRFNLIPFLATIPKEKRDPLLGEKLKAEYPGILKWAIEGCLEWQRDGLNPPAIVREATEEYINSQNVVSNWIEERCDKGRGLDSLGWRNQESRNQEANAAFLSPRFRNRLAAERR